MKLIGTVSEMREERVRIAGSVGFVPTMGALHDGHLSLVGRACQDNDHVVVSIFVNPTQFGPGEDYERYPRNTQRDLELLQSALSPPRPRSGRGGLGVRAIVFTPSVEEIYPAGSDDWVEVRGPLATRLEGAARPGHFRGVTTVVARLFRIVEPQRAYFGEKDAQQLRVVRRMVCDLGLPIEIVPVPTARDADGLALSSRNAYLSPQERRAALVLPRALELARKIVLDWGLRDADLLRESLEDYIRQVPQVHLEYISIADEATLEELQTIDRPALVLLAARVGSTRLIDNVLLDPAATTAPEPLLGTIDDLKAAMMEHGGIDAP